MGRRHVIVLDTHAWLWLVSDPTLLPRKVRTAVGREKRVGVSAISCWEVSMLVAKKRLSLDRPIETWINQALAELELCPLTPDVAILSANLGGFHGDPADRIIVATALAAKATLATKDRKIRSFKRCSTVWD